MCHTAPRHAAHLVDGRGLGRVGAADAKGDLPRRALADARLQDIAEVDVLDLVRLDAGIVEGLFGGDDTELGSGELLEDAVEAADGRAGGRDNDDLGQGGRRGGSGRVSAVGESGSLWTR